MLISFYYLVRNIQILTICFRKILIYKIIFYEHSNSLTICCKIGSVNIFRMAASLPILLQSPYYLSITQSCLNQSTKICLSSYGIGQPIKLFDTLPIAHFKKIKRYSSKEDNGTKKAYKSCVITLQIMNNHMRKGSSSNIRKKILIPKEPFICHPLQ